MSSSYPILIDPVSLDGNGSTTVTSALPSSIAKSTFLTVHRPSNTRGSSDHRQRVVSGSDVTSRTGRSTPVRSRSSAALNDTPGYADVRRIRVHTEEHNRILRSDNPVPPAGLPSGCPRLGR